MTEKVELKPGDSVRWKQGQGIACRVIGPATERVYNEECDVWEDELVEDRIKIHMVGDDHVFIVDEDELSPIDEEEFCGCCGQIGCPWG